MSRFLFVILVLVSGCGPLTSTPDRSEHSPGISDDRPTAGDIWLALAASVERGLITSPQRLAQFVVVLSRHGDLTADDVAQFDVAFPDAVSSDRPLNSDDVTRLRNLEMTGESHRR